MSRIINHRGGADVEALACVLVGKNADEETLEYARSVVRAQLQLLRIREIKRDLLERVYRLGMLEPPPRFSSRSAEVKYVLHQPMLDPLCWPEPVDPSGPMPPDKDARAAETTRRLLGHFQKLNRYERRAFKAKQQALSKLAACGAV